MVTVPQKQSPLEVATTGYIANEDYTTQYTGTNEDHAKTVLPYASARSGGGVSVDYTGGAVTLKSTVEGKGFDFYLPFQPGTAQDGNGKYTTPELSGEFTYEFDLNMLANAKSQGLWLYLQGQSGTNLARLVMNSASIGFEILQRRQFQFNRCKQYQHLRRYPPLQICSWNRREQRPLHRRRKG